MRFPVATLAAIAAAGFSACSPSTVADCSEIIWLKPTSNRNVLVNGERVPLEKVVPTLTERYADRKECRVMVRAEHDATYSDIIPLMNALDAAGFHKIAIVAEEVVQ